MHIWRNQIIVLLVPLLAAGAMLLAGAGCTSTPPQPAQVAGSPGQGQQLFASDQAAMQALLEAARNRDKEAMRKILGPATKELVSGDPVEDANDFEAFAKHAAEQTRLEKKDPATSIVHIGANDWPFPIPIVKADAQWFFDTEAGKAEILARRIGANELETIKVCRTYVQAQREYASKDRDGSGVLKYAQHLMSRQGATDGLYWVAAAGQEQSPFGPLMADAALEGYGQIKGHGPHAYHGYYFHILKKQGPSAPGGRYSYVINDNMIAGFALVACPAEYGSSGIMTFLVSHQGKLYQKDLGPQTQKIVHGLEEYNPDSSWTLVQD